MANIICPKCKHQFDNNSPESLVTRAAAAAATGTAGGVIGAKVGIAGGPFGAMNGLWIGAAGGAIAGWFAAD